MKVETRYNIAIVFAVAALVAAVAAFAAPTANEDYVDRQDARTYTNAVNAANAHTDAEIDVVTNAMRRVDDLNLYGTTGVWENVTYSSDQIRNIQNIRWESGSWKADYEVYVSEGGFGMWMTVTGSGSTDYGATESTWTSGNNYVTATRHNASVVVDRIETESGSAAKIETALEPYCTIEAARRMTNGLTKVTSTDVAGWGFLTGDWTGKTITAGSGTVINLGSGTTVRGTEDTTIQLGGGSLSVPANMTISVLGSRTLANYGIGNVYTKAEVDSLVSSATPDDYDTVKANASTGSTHAARTDNPHGVTAAQVGAFPAASGQTLQQAVQVISVHLNAEDARDIVTNYDSAVNMPSRRLEYKEPDGPNAGQFRVVWDELTRWNWLTGEYLPSNFYTKAEVDARTDHVQWGLFDSQTGNFSPDKTVQISSDRVILCKGASYQRTATASGTYFVWTSNEPYSITGVESNGYFRIEDAEGNVTFEIVKGDKVTAAATAGGVSTEQVMGITHLHIRYPIEADAHPTLEICNDLTTHDWKPETDPGCLANVTWSGVSGNYTAEVWGKSAEDALFVKATYERGSDPYVRYTQAIALQTVKIGNTIYYVGTATISGHTVLTLSLTPQ